MQGALLFVVVTLGVFFDRSFVLCTKNYQAKLRIGALPSVTVAKKHILFKMFLKTHFKAQKVQY
jgi:hypothetical protein